MDVFTRAAGVGSPLVSDLNTGTNQRFGSAHTGVVQFLYGDGSVRGVGVNVAETTLSLLVQRADGQPIPAYE